MKSPRLRWIIAGMLFLATMINYTDRLALSGLLSACSLLRAALPEREPHPALWFDTVRLFDELGAEGWTSTYLRWELRLLEDLGFGLDLSSCAVTGATEGLAYVHPGFKTWILPIAVGILVGLFTIQSRGTAKVGALFGRVAIGKIGSIAAAADHFTDGAGGHVIAGVIDHADIDARHDAADRAGVREPFLGGQVGDIAHFGRAVIFVDDRPPPVDHRALDRRRAGRGGVCDIAQRAQVIFAPHLGGQP